ncbi:MAG: vWA domain-containing protein, partial [Bacteroidota bacterium]
ENFENPLEINQILLEGQEPGPIPPFHWTNWVGQQRLYSQEGVALILFNPSATSSYHWHWNISQEDYRTPFRFRDRQQLLSHFPPYEGFTGDEDLRLLFAPQFEPPNGFWATHRSVLKSKGFFIPRTEIRDLAPEDLKQMLTYLFLRQKYFSIPQLLEGIKQDTQRKDFADLPLPLIAMWHFGEEYSRFLKEARRQDAKRFKDVQGLFDALCSIEQFEQQLPSMQAFLLLQALCHRSHSPSKKNIFDKLLPRSAEHIQAFWKEQQVFMEHYLQHGYNNTYKWKDEKQALSSIVDIKRAFYDCLCQEEHLFAWREIMDDPAELNFAQYLPKALQDLYGPLRVRSFVDKMKGGLGNSIFSRLQSMADSRRSKALVNLWPREGESSLGKWQELSANQRDELQEGIEQHFSPIKLKDLQKLGRDRWEQSLLMIGNRMTAPFLHWHTINGKALPKWNLLPTKSTEQLEQLFFSDRRLEMEEAERLQQLLEELSRTVTLQQIQSLGQQQEEFSLRSNQMKWLRALRNRQASVKNQQEYRVRRMREFGIVEGDEIVDYRKNIWLNEMLQIEKEVSPYILFVKKAFQAALPVRKTVEFDPYRHSHDGIEFDPQTIQDQEKWMRAQVMKSFRTRIDKGEVEQINAFALDSSGSMDHEKMRKLFKILYLLVLGLEDRKSHDSFHFFGTDFIEAANFTRHYTDRTLLFKTLLRVAQIKEGAVIYGGKGGTNISAGVIECHKRVREFSEKLKEQSPNVLQLSSVFVITDGEPSMGLVDPAELCVLIEQKRMDGNVAIKGIYLKPVGEDSRFMEEIFGPDNYLESDDFTTAINEFVYIMAMTYKAQRKQLKEAIKAAKAKKNHL